MHSSKETDDCQWAQRVNHVWIVRNRLDDNAAAWLQYLSQRDDPRLVDCCRAARRMCELRPKYVDPKPWFYSGLFSLATHDEARNFLADHLVTLAAVPAMSDDEKLEGRIAGISPEIRRLIVILRQTLTKL